jgi:hypothetical protein
MCGSKGAGKSIRSQNQKKMRLKAKGLKISIKNIKHSNYFTIFKEV